MIFRDRVEAGQKLAQALSHYKDGENVVYALPRGGVVIGAEVAGHLKASLQLLIARKIGHPSWPEYAIGAVTETGEPIWNEREAAVIGKSWLDEAVHQQRQEARRRHQEYIGKKSGVSPEGQTALIVDDGIATGLTMIAAIKELRTHKPKEIVVAAPVAPEDAARELKKYADTVVALYVPPTAAFGAIGSFYENFYQVEDHEVRQIMAKYQ